MSIEMGYAFVMLDPYGPSVCFSMSALEACLKIGGTLKSVVFGGLSIL